MWNHEHLWLSWDTLISVHASTSAARSCPQLLYLRNGGGNHFCRCLFYQKRLSTKLTLANQFKKITWRRGRVIEIPGWVDKEHSDVRKPKALCVRECQMIIWQTESQDSNEQLENTPAAWTHTHPAPNFPSAAALSIHAATTTTAMPSSLNLVLSKKRTELSASSPRQAK